MSNEDRGPSPADGPAKVFGREPLPTSAMPGEATHLLTLENLCFQWFAGNGVYLDADKDSSGNAEALAMATLSALLSFIPPEQVVQALEQVVPNWDEKESRNLGRTLAGGSLNLIRDLGEIRRREKQERDEALARAEKAEAEAAASWQFAELARVKAKEAGDRAFRASERANSAERERDAMHAAAEELRAQGAEVGEDCVFCKGTGRSCGNKHCGWPWCASCKACNGTGRKTEESDGRTEADASGHDGRDGEAVRPTSDNAQDERVDSGAHSSVAVPAKSGREDVLIEVSSGNLPPIEVPDVFGMLSERLGYTKPARPPCIPSRIPDTDWTVIEGRAVWSISQRRLLCIERRDGFGGAGWELFRETTYEGTIGDFRADVPQSLFLAARRWMGWEKEETAVAGRNTPSWQNVYYDIRDSGTLVIHYDRERNGGGFVIETMKETYVGHGDVDQEFKEIQFLRAVDLTELREAANKRRDYLALSIDARSPLQETLNDRAVLAAVEKLLSSGGAP